MVNAIGWLGEILGLSETFVAHHLHVFTTLFVTLVIAVLALLAWRRLRDTEACVVPSDRPTLAGLFELIVELVLGLMRDIMGKRADKYFPLLGALFIYLLVSNLIGVVPGFVPPTDNINTTLACGIVIFIYYNVVGIKAQGIVGYLKHMTGPVLWLAPLMLAIELVSHLVRPASLSVRLFGNMTGDHLVLEMFSGLIPLVLPVVFMCLAIFVSFIQAFVFTLLSMVYIGLATDAEAH